MCGIAGIFVYKNHGPPADREELLRIQEAMTARGPDGAGLWISQNNRIGLASRRLAILDLSHAGDQPMSSEDGLLRIVFNGEIYNYRTLRASLEQKGYRFHSNCDTEVLLHLYADKGPEMVHDLRGMYAFAIWDERKRGLFLVRDPFGIKPLYYSDNGHTLRFASQVKALLKGGGAGTVPEPAGHVGFFLWGYVPEPYTLYKGIRALPAGSTLWIDDAGRHALSTFYDISSVLAESSKTYPEMSREEAQKRLHVALEDSVRHHLIADVPVGVFLSSGLDSNTVATLASEVTPGNLRTVTLGFQEHRGTRADETKLAERVAKRYGAAHQTRWISYDDFHTNLPHVLDAMDQPSFDGINTYFVSKVAAEAGLKVAISGLGGDELFGGYPSFRDVPRMVKVGTLVRGIPGLGKMFRVVSAPVFRNITSPKYAGLLEYSGSYGGAYLLRRGLFMPWELADIVDGGMLREGWAELEPVARLNKTVRTISGERAKIAALELQWYMRNQLLRDSDWAGMAHSLEVRVPMVDVELLRTVGPMLGMSPPLGKLDMAASLATPLPTEVLHHPKRYFAIPVREWLLQAAGNDNRELGLRGLARRVYSAYLANE